MRTQSRKSRQWATRHMLGAALALLTAANCASSSASKTGVTPDSLEGTPAPIVNLEPVTIGATDPRVGVMGRVVSTESGGLEFGFPGVTTRTCFRGNRLWVTGSSNQGRSHLAVVYQGTAVGELVVPKLASELLVWTAPGGVVADYCVDLVHLTETWIGVVTLRSFRVEGEVLPAAPFPTRRLLFIGDSVTCGEAVRRKPECSKDETWWDAHDSYGALTARTLGAQYQLVCFGGKGVVRDWQGERDVLNAPEFFGLAIPDERQLPYALPSYTPDGIVVSLGTNDFNAALGAFPARREFVNKYVTFVQRLQATYPAAQIWLTEGAIVSDDTVETPLKGGAPAEKPGAKQKTTLRSYIEEVVSVAQLANLHFLPAKRYPADTCDAHPLATEHQDMAKDVVSGIRQQLSW